MALLLSGYLLSMVNLMILGFAESTKRNYLDKPVALGKDVTLVCSGSTLNTTQITWSKGSVTIYSIKGNKTVRNFASNRFSIERPYNELKISRVEQVDTGLFNCGIDSYRGHNKTQWNLTIIMTSPKINTTVESKITNVTSLSSATGVVVLCSCIICFIWLWRKHYKEHAQDHCTGKESESGTSYDQTTHQVNRSERSQYCERLNSIYGQF